MNPLRGVLFCWFVSEAIPGHKREYGLLVLWEDVLGSDTLKRGLEISGFCAHLFKLQLTQ